jgi:hypothetical protein
VTTLSIQATDRLEAQLKARSASESAPLYCELAPSESESDGLERLEERDRARAVFAQRRYGGLLRSMALFSLRQSCRARQV